MRAALWFVGLFGAAVAAALFVGNNQGTVSVFWPPYRVDLSLNMVLLLLLGGFSLLYAALRALATLQRLPLQARRWRAQQKERRMHAALLDAHSHLLAGRFVRGRQAALLALSQEQALNADQQAVAHGRQLRLVAHLVAAECSHALQDASTRQTHFEQALETFAQQPKGAQLQWLEGAQLRAARWALDERDAAAALALLGQLSSGSARRTLALRVRLKAARLSGQTQQALETARLLTKHRAFTPLAAHGILRSLCLELIQNAHDPAQLQQTWDGLEPAERDVVEVAVAAAQRMAELGGSSSKALSWLQTSWPGLTQMPHYQALKWIQALESHLSAVDHAWLARFETAQRQQPHQPLLQYLVALACLQHELWGKAQQWLTQVAQQAEDERIQAKAWRYLAQLAEQRDDSAGAAQAWKNAALLM